MTQGEGWQVPGTGADIYETVFAPGMIGPWAPEVLALAAPAADERVLDIACGTGVLTLLAAKAVGPRGQVTGVDLSPDMLEVARRHTGGSSEAPIDWRECDAERLPFEDQAFDIALCQLGLMFFEDRAKALSEMARVLAPNGRVAIMVWGAIDRCPGQLAMRNAWLRAYGPDGIGMFEAQHSLSDPRQLHDLLTGAGFDEVDVAARMGSVHLASAEQLARGYGAMAEMPPEGATTVINDVNDALASYDGPGGLEYPIEGVLASARKR